MNAPGESQYYFHEESADRVCRFFETQLTHFEGRFAGQPFTLLPWQRTLLRDVFGWKRHDGTRRYRTIYVEVPRKQGKSALCSGLALYLTCADHEAGAQVFSAACNTQQANITFLAAKKMVEASPALRKRLHLKQYTIEHATSQSIYRALSGENVGAHGKNVHGLIIDELHEWTSPASRELYEALVTSMGMRSQPLTVHITTAGHGGEETLCLQLHKKALRYINGEVQPGDADYDDTFYSVIYAASPDDPIDNVLTWAKANPSLGETVPVDYYRREAVKAKESPVNLNTFKRLFLNIWTEAATRWLDLSRYDACVMPVDEAELDGIAVYLGIDLSQTYDITAAMRLYTPPSGPWVLVPRLYCPLESAQKRYKEDGFNYPQWIKDGYIIGTEGESIDYRVVEADIVELASRSPILEAGFDPYNAAILTGNLEKSGILTVPVYQTYLGMNAACKELERRLVSHEIIVADNPCLRWMAANTEVEQDRHSNIRIVKPRQSGKYAGTGKYKVDGIVAAVIAVSRAMLHQNENTAGKNEPIAIFI